MSYSFQFNGMNVINKVMIAIDNKFILNPVLAIWDIVTWPVPNTIALGSETIINPQKWRYLNPKPLA